MQTLSQFATDCEETKRMEYIKKTDNKYYLYTDKNIYDVMIKNKIVYVRYNSMRVLTPFIRNCKS